MEAIELQDLKERVRALGLSRVRKDPDASEEFAKYYRRVFKQPVCSTCPGKLEKAYNEFLNFNITTFMEKSNRRYNFKKKNVLKHFVNPIAGIPSILNNNNLRDEHVPLIIAHNPKAADWFTDSQEGEVKAPKKKVSPPAAEPTALELKIEEIDSLMSIKEIKDKLKELEIPFRASATKSEVVKILAEATVGK